MQAIKSAGAGTCEWKETYTLQEFAPKSSSTLEVTVYNHNTLRPDGTLGLSLLVSIADPIFDNCYQHYEKFAQHLHH